MKVDVRALLLRYRLVELAAGLCALGLVLRARALLPAQHFSDGDYIAALNNGTTAIRPDPYYRSIAVFYALLGLDDHPRVTAMLQLALFVAAIALALGPAARWSTMALAAAAIGLGGVYLTQYSKDAVVLLFVLPILLVLRIDAWSAVAPYVTAGSLLVYGTLFRSTWLVIAALFVTGYVALHRGGRPALLLPIAAAMFVIAGVGTFVLHHDTLDPVRAANAMVEGVLTFAALLLPIPLAMAGGWAHMLGALVLTVFTVRMTAAARHSAGRPSLGVAVSLLLAFVVTQALATPYFGAHLKHLTPMLPLAVFALATADRAARERASVWHTL
ncbi:hypothetical protein [Dactylosporangium sp. NPDC051541]|uniref:hypothetical protein n=1 Tax=Dactylosporangium sp. NPDC051541 TaxID=3363977 RepID=UPI00378D90FA